MDPTPELSAPGPQPSAGGFGTHFDPFSAPIEAVVPASASAPAAAPALTPAAAPALAGAAVPAPAPAPVRTASVAPPGWKPSQAPALAGASGGTAAALPGGGVALPGSGLALPGAVPALPAPAYGALARSTPADAAIRWRLRAARIDNLIVYGGYFLLCLALHRNPFSPSSLLLGFGLSVVYHFLFEVNGGQTPGKRRVGVQVVSVDGGRPDAKAIAIRSVLRLVDQLPVWYASGLVSMIRTGAHRRQRIGDVAAGTMVVAVDGRAAALGTPSWGLPLATVLAVLLSAAFVYRVSNAGTGPLTAEQQAQFISNCQAASPPGTDCTCILTQLQADGYDSLDSLNGLLAQSQAAVVDGRPSEIPQTIVSAVRVCTRG